MKLAVMTVCLLSLVAPPCFAEEAVVQLPTPDYHREPSDPPWLTYAVQFHGHLGPWAMAGLRLGEAGRRAVQGNGYFDVSVVAQGPFVAPPKSCFLDGLQVATGATWGKRNLEYARDDDLNDIVVCVRHARTGAVAEVRPTAKLLELLSSFQSSPKVAAAGQSEHERDSKGNQAALEAIARQIARMPEQEIVTITLKAK